ncbi:branched-chain amino acid ABC transporter substrate-binding protein [Brevibacillus laterosporus]|uniref:ABC-type branched-chain amino acid transport systems, periplasmic binding protein n=1 Tax=Brevibacillus laterosporus LMG 15441 TaxID=1042163 RepID=A0A075R093_BRELA|nr:branched-chain amino acid ABC transporter substrate-binding protein [Brevibacillus laterosporus]WPS88278.1 branched-chain amino acid ABC transporter substrate-binding protein [Brevibacillus halotolerans]AIG24856.1 ABC-type branched-chain amino acid transport systems, periplasmic binding protein [Brevibacillus laterosporus LMG 15441]MDF9412436.1 branched-chain amino acid ABC transporter substrate-binding protein [Brevibacillus laterosporus]RJL11131.1 branched-chain amino acid ABC transporter 
MNKKASMGLLTAILITGLALSGCAGAGQGTGKEVIKIATQSPLSGAYANIGDAIKQGAGYALQEEKEEFAKMGFDLQLFPQDDQADPKQGVTNAQLLVANKDVLGVIGHYNTGVAVPSSSKYEAGKLVMVSPANTGTNLTEEGKKTVHRICARNDAQGPAAARYAKNTLGVKTVFIITDKTAYGTGLTDQVKAQFEKDGVEILGFEGITVGEKDYSAVVNQVVTSKPDLVFFGGIYTEGGLLFKQARDKGYQGIFMGGDGIDSSELVTIAGSAAEGVIYTSAAGDVTQTAEGKKWAEAYEKATNKKLEAYSVYGYDAMKVLLHGLQNAIKANGNKKPSREQVLDAVHKTKDFQAQFTKVTFTEKGDNEFAQIFVYKFENGKATYVGKIE